MWVDLFRFTSAEIVALLLSIKVAFWCTLAITVPGILMAWLLARKSFFGKSLINALVYMPLVLPPVVPGFLLLLLLGNHGLIGKYLYAHWGISIAFTWFGAAIASAVMAFPLMVSAAKLAIIQVDADLEVAAQSLGAHPIRAFFTVTLPLAAPGILTGLILSFSRSLGEFGATMAFVGNIEGETRTLPLAIFTYIQTPGSDVPAIRLVILSLVIALCALMGSQWLERKALAKQGRDLK